MKPQFQEVEPYFVFCRPLQTAEMFPLFDGRQSLFPHLSRLLLATHERPQKAQALFVGVMPTEQKPGPS